MGSKDWRERADALRALAALAPAAHAISDAGLEALVGGLGGRLGDGNSKVVQQALEVGGCALVCAGTLWHSTVASRPDLCRHVTAHQQCNEVACAWLSSLAPPAQRLQLLGPPVPCKWMDTCARSPRPNLAPWCLP